jgi:hypothetical protein
MGDSRSKYYDDWDDYRDFCESLKVQPKDDFYTHETELLKELGFKNMNDYYQSLRVAEVRDKKIDLIIKPDYNI